jgi:hypothetical protein
MPCYRTINVKLLGVTIDYELNFDKHISEICKKSARQLNMETKQLDLFIVGFFQSIINLSRKPYILKCAYMLF